MDYFCYGDAVVEILLGSGADPTVESHTGLHPLAELHAFGWIEDCVPSATAADSEEEGAGKLETMLSPLDLLALRGHIDSLVEDFEAIDIDGDGTCSIDELRHVLPAEVRVCSYALYAFLWLDHLFIYVSIVVTICSSLCSL